MTIRESVNSIYKAREELLNDLEGIRDNCEHKEMNVMKLKRAATVANKRIEAFTKNYQEFNEIVGE